MCRRFPEAKRERAKQRGREYVPNPWDASRVCGVYFWVTESRVDPCHRCFQPEEAKTASQHAKKQTALCANKHVAREKSNTSEQKAARRKQGISLSVLWRFPSYSAPFSREGGGSVPVSSRSSSNGPSWAVGTKS